MQKNKAFTIAEILITLTIIGVIASITIITVLNDTRKQVLYSKFINTYSTLSRAFQLLKADGEIDSVFLNSYGRYGDTRRASQNAYDNMILSRLRYTVKCQPRDSKCFKTKEHLRYKTLSGNKDVPMFLTTSPVYTLPNGADFMIGLDSYSVSGGNIDQETGEILSYNDTIGYRTVRIRLDTNGIEKGPNTLGRDAFYFTFYPFTGFLIPGNTFLGHINLETRTTKINENAVDKYCDPKSDNDYSGSSCGLKLLREKKMNY